MWKRNTWKLEQAKKTCLPSGNSTGLCSHGLLSKGPPLPQNSAQGKASTTTYSVLQRCSNVVPSSAGDDWDIFKEGESDKG